jgi:hypothetical protein
MLSAVMFSPLTPMQKQDTQTRIAPCDMRHSFIKARKGRKQRESRSGSVLLPSEPTLLLLALLVEGTGCAIRAPSLLRSGLLALLYIPSARTAAALTQSDKESEDRGCSCYPHERKHLRANFALDVQLLNGGNGSLHDDEKHCCDDRGDSGEKGGQECEDGDE